VHRLLPALPLAVVAVLTFIALWPPQWFLALGWARFPLVALVVVALLLAAVAAIILSNLPRVVRLSPVSPDRASAAMLARASEFRSLGFVDAGPPLELNVSPPSLVLGLVAPDCRSYASVFRTGDGPGIVSFDVFSYFAGATGGLTTAPARGAGLLPAAPGSLTQVFQGSPPTSLVEHHGRGLDFLAERGIACRELSGERFAADVAWALERQRRNIRSHIVRAAVTSTWRAVTRATPHLGPIETQLGVLEQLDALARSG
jgi:hypothetical protein